MPPIPGRELTKIELDCTTEFFVGNCIDIIPELGKFNFIFSDPPFNIGQDYQGYDDKVDESAYDYFTDKWMECCHCAMEDVSAIALHGPDFLVRKYINFRDKWVAWINWHYRFGQCGRGNWIDARCHCLIYSGSNGHKWNPGSVLVESDRVAYGDKRIHETENGGKRLPGTVWGVPSDGPNWGRVQGNNLERRPGHPNQLPVVYLARLIRAYTDPGDRVLDPFCGLGVTAAVCQELGRKCFTIDISSQSIAYARERCANLELRAITRERLGLS